MVKYATVSALEHLGRSILGSRYSPDGLFLMMTCYFDESGGKEHGLTVVAGYVSTIQQWEHFEVDWKLFLISYKVPYFHMAELSQFKGPYAKWKNSPNFRARFINEAASIIQSRVQRGFSCFVAYEAFERLDVIYKLRETLGSPYALSGMLCVSNANVWRRRIKEPVDFEYVFEDGAPDKHGLLTAMEKAGHPAPIFKPSRDIKDRKHGIRKGLVHLQAADYLAYEIRKYIQEQGSSKRQTRTSLVVLTGVDIDRYFLGYERMARVCQELRLERRNKTQ
jgi:hypothetical protein